MKRITDVLFVPMKIAGRIAIGSAGILLMAGGMLAWDVLETTVLGVPLLIVGLLLLVRAIF